MAPELLTLAGITLVAATINGALGYGFSSITVPLALFFFTNRVLNPALVLLEVVLNANVLFVNRAKLTSEFAGLVSLFDEFFRRPSSTG